GPGPREGEEPPGERRLPGALGRLLGAGDLPRRPPGQHGACGPLRLPAPQRGAPASALELSRGALLGNMERAALFDYRRRVALLGKPVDRGDWCMEPQTVNAVNLPLHSALNFPAAILEPPFFDPRAPAAVNYGGVGTVIGHEVSHSFDDQGAMFDADGRLRNWWTP